MLPNRIYTLDIARGLASLCVVLWHWQHFFYDHGNLSEHFQQQQQPFFSQFALCYKRGGFLGVSFFFALSGFVFFWLYQKKIESHQCPLRQFAVLRFARLYPLHLATLIGITILQTLYYRRYGYFFVYQFNDAYHFLLQLFFASNWGLESGWSFNGPNWSVSMEVGLYALFFTTTYIGITSLPRCLIVVAAIFAMQKLHLFGWWPIPAESFYVGGLTWYAVDWYLRHRHFAVDCAVITAAVVGWVSIALSDDAARLILNKYHLYVLYLCPMTISSLVICESSLERFAKKISWVGDITYSTYLLHFPLQLVFSVIATEMGYTSQVFYTPQSFILFFSVLVGTSLATFYWFERPMQSFIRKSLLMITPVSA